MERIALCPAVYRNGEQHHSYKQQFLFFSALSTGKSGAISRQPRTHPGGFWGEGTVASTSLPHCMVTNFLGLSIVRTKLALNTASTLNPRWAEFTWQTHRTPSRVWLRVSMSCVEAGLNRCHHWLLECSASFRLFKVVCVRAYICVILTSILFKDKCQDLRWMPVITRRGKSVIRVFLCPSS